VAARRWHRRQGCAPPPSAARLYLRSACSGWQAERGGRARSAAFLVQALLRYAAKNKCTPWTGYPVTLELNKTETCGEFFRNNAQWARKPDQLWFMKAIDGSTGRHINLMRRNDIEALHAAGDFACPMNGSIASLEVPGAPAASPLRVRG
jgi:hypothetical protein